MFGLVPPCLALVDEHSGFRRVFKEAGRTGKGALIQVKSGVSDGREHPPTSQPQAGSLRWIASGRSGAREIKALDRWNGDDG
jgi:hypothetical protein